MSYSSWLRGPGLIRSGRIITRALPGAFPWRICWGSANWTAPATGLAAETPDDRKDLECASLPVCLKPSDGRRGQYPKSCTPLLVRRSSLLPAQLFTASPTIERWYWDRPIVVHSEVGVTAADRHIPAWERRIDGNKALQLRRISLRERGRIDAEAFSRRGRQEVERMAWHGMAGRKAYSGSARAVREAYMNPLISPSLPSLSTGISFAVQLCSQQPVENFSNTLSHFHALEMATLAFKPYTYKPTAPRSKSTATHRRPAPEQVSILNKLQHITSSGASLSTPRPAADDGGYRPGIRGMWWRCVGL